MPIMCVYVTCYSKDVRLPEMMQRAMAKEAEAHRDAQAKVRTKNPFQVDSITRICFALLHLCWLLLLLYMYTKANFILLR